MADNNAAENLVGLTLDTGWTVTEMLVKPPGATGSFFSICYKVKKGDEICFLKAFNFARFFQISATPGKSKQIVDVISEMVDAYKYERELSNMCRDHHVTKVAFVREAGEQIVLGYPITLVPYLIFDLADGDVRSRLTFASNVESIWKLRSLHSIAVGLKQLHTIQVSHQDLKPSNVLLFNSESKLGDLGRSTCPTLDSPHKGLPFAGDYGYAPPEILYNHFDADWKRRSFAADCYLFGSMMVFYFAGVSMNAMLRKQIPDDVSWEYYHGTFDNVKGYLLSGFAKALDEFESCIPDPILKKDLRAMVEYLCYPLPERRGHPKILGITGNQYDMERIISQLDCLRRKATIELRR